MQTSHKYLDPVALSRIGGMELVARLVVEGFVTGLHKSPRQRRICRAPTIYAGR